MTKNYISQRVTETLIKPRSLNEKKRFQPCLKPLALIILPLFTVYLQIKEGAMGSALSQRDLRKVLDFQIDYVSFHLGSIHINDIFMTANESDESILHGLNKTQNKNISTIHSWYERIKMFINENKLSKTIKNQKEMPFDIRKSCNPIYTSRVGQWLDCLVSSINIQES